MVVFSIAVAASSGMIVVSDICSSANDVIGTSVTSIIAAKALPKRILALFIIRFL